MLSPEQQKHFPWMQDSQSELLATSVTRRLCGLGQCLPLCGSMLGSVLMALTDEIPITDDEAPEAEAVPEASSDQAISGGIIDVDQALSQDFGGPETIAYNPGV